MSVLHLAMEYCDVRQRLQDALDGSAEAYASGDMDQVAVYEKRYAEASREHTKLVEYLQRIPVPREIAAERPIASLSHDEIVVMAGRVPGCDCDSCAQKKSIQMVAAFEEKLLKFDEIFCPKCGGKLREAHDHYNHLFRYCGCGYRIESGNKTDQDGGEEVVACAST